MNKKYELTDETKEIVGITLHRIRALRDIPRHGVRSGDLGGWIEKENNLSHEGDAWVSGDARVSGNASVFGDAWVYGNAKVCDDAWVYGNAEVCDDAEVYGNAKVYGNAWVYGDAEVYGNAEVCGDAKVMDLHSYAVYKNSWSSGRWFTYTRSNKMWKVGCFYGNGEELIKKAYADSELSGKCYEAIVRAVETIEAAQAEVSKKPSVAIVTGLRGKARGAIGSWIVLTERDDNCDIIGMKAFCIDGEKYKANTWYTLSKGKVVKVEEWEC